MELLCAKCRHLVDAEQCSCCGSWETRVPESEDSCFLTTLTGPGAAVLSERLEQDGIPFRKLIVNIGRITVTYAFYVPYGRLEDALAEVEKMWGDEEAMANNDKVFSAEEIDVMDIGNLESMDLEELKAYKAKIISTLKEIKFQEQKWKERTNLLLDMREEAENLIDDLS